MAVSREDFDKADLRVREKVPEYGRIFLQCKPQMNAMLKAETKGESKEISEASIALTECTFQAMCPDQFAVFTQCDNKSKSNCREEENALGQCVRAVSMKVYHTIEQELNKD